MYAHNGSYILTDLEKWEVVRIGCTLTGHFCNCLIKGIYYAARIKDLGRQQLYSCIPKKQYQQLHYSPLSDRYINLRLIQDSWDDILRLMATLKTKKSSASQILKRINSYARQHPLYRDLKEFGKIIKSAIVSS